MPAGALKCEEVKRAAFLMALDTDQTHVLAALKASDCRDVWFRGLH